MGYLLDTNIVSAYLRGDRRVGQRFNQYGGRLYISTVVLAEVSVWPRLNNSPVRQADVDLLIPEFRILPVDERVALRFAVVRSDLMNGGISLPTPDLLIAVTALEHSLVMVTANRRHFDPVPGLRVEDWTTP